MLGEDEALETLVRKVLPGKRFAFWEGLSSNTRERTGDLLFAHIDLHFAEGNSQAADELLGIAREIDSGARVPVFYYQYQKRVAKAFEEKGDLEGALASYEILHSFLQKERMPEALAEIIMEMGILHDRLGRVEEALRHFRRAASIYRDVGHGYNYAAALFNMAFVHFDKKEIEEAINYSHQVLEIEERQKTPSLAAHALLELANIYESTGNRVLARGYYEKALRQYRQMGDRSKVGDILHKIGFFDLENKRYASSSDYFREALGTKKEIDYCQAMAKYYFARGTVLKEIGAQRKALSFFDRALSFTERLSQEKGALRIKFRLHMIFSKEGTGLFFLPEFLKDYKASFSVDSLLEAGRKGMYHVRRGEGGSTRLFQEEKAKEKPLVDRKLLSSLLSDLGRVCQLQGEEREFSMLRRQAKAVESHRQERNR